ncbi:hypothetical protein B0H10DRAFT_1662544, partial [Mycena sp. CBHHK59/15]
WNAKCDATLVGQLAVEKAAGNQTDNAGWHASAWTVAVAVLAGSEKKSGGSAKMADVCLSRWGMLKAQYALVKSLREKSGWGWNDEEKHIAIEDSVWDVYLRVSPSLHPWHHRGFLLFDKMADL